VGLFEIRLQAFASDCVNPTLAARGANLYRDFGDFEDLGAEGQLERGDDTRVISRALDDDVARLEGRHGFAVGAVADERFVPSNLS
jgi:hypothetical protein